MLNVFIPSKKNSINTSSTAMREILGAAQQGVDSMAMSFSAAGSHSSPFRSSGTLGTFTPATTMSRTYDSFTPHRSSSPTTQTAKKSKLSISTPAVGLNRSMNRSSSGIALASSSPPKRRPTSAVMDGMHSTGRSTGRSIGYGIGHHSEMNTGGKPFPNLGASLSHSRLLPPSMFMSTTDSLQEQMNRTQSNIDPNEAKSLYFAHYNGLEAIGQSGMTVLEELIDAALNVCEKSRQTASQQQSHTHSRSAVLLTCTGKTYAGCDVHIASNSTLGDNHGVSAERAAFLEAVADGAQKFDVSCKLAHVYGYLVWVAAEYFFNFVLCFFIP